MHTVKMVVSGAAGAGKSLFIRSLSEIPVVSTERKAVDETRLLKSETTVSIDFGRLALATDLALDLYGTPGQRRFDFMWEILAEGTLGLVVIVDSTRPETFRETLRIVEFFERIRPVPYIVAANKQDLPAAWSPDEIRLALRLPEHVKVVPCVAQQRERCKQVALELLYDLLEPTTG